jgi:hypothetical protein
VIGGAEVTLNHLSTGTYQTTPTIQNVRVNTNNMIADFGMSYDFFNRTCYRPTTGLIF